MIPVLRIHFYLIDLGRLINKNIELSNSLLAG